MKSKFLSNPIKKCLQGVLLLAILVFNFGVSGVSTVYAVPPGNNLFANRTFIGSLPYNPPISTPETQMWRAPIPYFRRPGEWGRVKAYP
jgi:hypothetical protein